MVAGGGAAVGNFTAVGGKGGGYGGALIGGQETDTRSGRGGTQTAGGAGGVMATGSY